MDRFKSNEILSDAWKKTKSNLGVVIASSLIFYAISGAGSSIGDSLFFVHPIAGIVVSIFFAALAILIHIGIIIVALKICDNKPVSLKDLFSGGSFFWKFSVSVSYYSIIIFIGFLLLIVPGIVWAITYQFFPYIVVDDKTITAWGSLKKSKKIIKNYRWEILWLDIVIFFINFLGFLFFGVGIVITYPFGFIAYSCAYRKLLEYENRMHIPISGEKTSNLQGPIEPR